VKSACNRILFAIVFFITISPPGSMPCASAQDIEADRLLGFAESLFKEGDYYRAISEYKRFIHYYPSAKSVESASFRIAESYYKARRWQDAIKLFKEFIDKYPGSDMIYDAFFLKGLSEKNLKKYDEALLSFEEILKRATGQVRHRAIYESALVHVEREDWGRARETFSEIPGESGLHDSAGRWLSGLLRINELPEKSPAVAGTLAALIPGSGHVYTERYRDALVSFLLNGAFIFAAIELFRHDNNIAGGIVTFFEVGWYTGNIYSAVSSAHKYNRRVKDEFIQKLKETSSISFRHDPKSSANCIMYSMTY
jgi:hypothetical protein